MSYLNIFKQFVKSLYSPKDIAKFRFQGIGKTILYIFLLMLISVIPVAYHFTSMTLAGLEAGQNTLTKDLPDFKIDGGQLQSDSSKPVFVKKDGMTIVLDSTGTVTDQELKEKENAIGLLQTEAVITANGKVQKYPYSTFNGLHITNKDISSFLKSFKDNIWIILPVLFLIYYLFVSAVGFIKVSIFALIGTVLAGIQSKKLPYRQSYRITAYAITLPTVFFALMDLLKTAVPLGAVLDWAVIMIMLTLVIKEMPKPKVK
ncbi:DUF1189 domain-containing protein [Falsibacillus pallidus]|uniref:DUF1189 domain-containing protein n=1 Tax=Falsibacillus pallidus TaxID=493781 RepID=UPI001FE848B0|nr:DUF1189 domain-containing protein [Falsibacillus pallidus]